MTIRIIAEVNKDGSMWCTVSHRGVVVETDMSEERLVNWLSQQDVKNPEALLPALREHGAVDVHEHWYGAPDPLTG